MAPTQSIDAGAPPRTFLDRAFEARTLFILSGLFILYATTVPFQFDRAPSMARVELFPVWDPVRHRLHGIPDMVQNVLLFMPLGFFGFFGLPALRKDGPARAVMLLGLFGFGLSLFVESLQTMSETRDPSATDVFTNTSGAAIGALIAAVFATRLEASSHRALSRLARHHPGLIVVLGALLGVLGTMLAPFIPTLDLGMAKAKIHEMLDHPFGTKPVGGLLFDAAVFGGLSFLACFELPAVLVERGLIKPDSEQHPAREAVTVGVLIALLALVLEALQLPLIHHTPAIKDALFNVLGAAAGAGTAILIGKEELRPAHQFGERVRRWPALGIGFGLGLPVLRGLAPFQLRPISEGLAGFHGMNLLPFWSLFANLRGSTLANVFEAALVYIPLGYVLSAAGKRPAVVFVWALLLAEGLEILQLGIVARTSDVTEGLLAAVGSLAGCYLYERLGALTKSTQKASVQGLRDALGGHVGGTSADYARPGRYE